MALHQQERKVISTLNGLIETCKNGQYGFETAAQGVKNLDFAALFNRYAMQRAEFAQELQDLVRRLGGTPEEGGSAAGAAHRGWIGVKSAVTDGDENAIIAECERGEDIAKKDYEEALHGQLPNDIRSVVARQYADVKAAHDHIRALEHAAA